MKKQNKFYCKKLNKKSKQKPIFNSFLLWLFLILKDIDRTSKPDECKEICFDCMADIGEKILEKTKQ